MNVLLCKLFCCLHICVLQDIPFQTFFLTNLPIKDLFLTVPIKCPQGHIPPNCFNLEPKVLRHPDSSLAGVCNKYEHNHVDNQ